MTQRSGLPPWFYRSQARPSADLPEMESLRPWPPEPKTRKPQARPKQKTSTKRATAARATGDQPRIRRGPSIRAKRIQAQSQPRDQQGRFAEKGNWLTRLLDPTPRPPTRLKKISKPVPNGPPPRARANKKQRKKPVPERSFLGRVGAVLNGDYARWRRADLRRQAALRIQIEGYGPPKKRVPRRRKPRYLEEPVQPPRRKGMVRRILRL